MNRLHGKEGVDGSSPSEGFINAPQMTAFSVEVVCRISSMRDGETGVGPELQHLERQAESSDDRVVNMLGTGLVEPAPRQAAEPDAEVPTDMPTDVRPLFGKGRA
jgi:hypothetical protein